MKYTEINEKLEILRDIIRGKMRQEVKAETKDQEPPKWDGQELTDFLTDILDTIEGLNNRINKLERKLKE